VSKKRGGLDSSPVEGKQRESRAKSKALLATSLGVAGAAAGSPGGPVGAGVGGALGVLAGLIVGDQDIVFTVDYVAVPAFEYGMLRQGVAPSHTIYIKAGETLVATGGNVDDVELGIAEAVAVTEPVKSKRKASAYNRRYAAAFRKVSGKYRKKNGQWKKGGFKAAGKAAHKIAGGKK